MKLARAVKGTTRISTSSASRKPSDAASSGQLTLVEALPDAEVRREIALAREREGLLESEQALAPLVEARAPAQIVEREPAPGVCRSGRRQQRGAGLGRVVAGQRAGRIAHRIGCDLGCEEHRHRAGRDGAAQARARQDGCGQQEQAGDRAQRVDLAAPVQLAREVAQSGRARQARRSRQPARRARARPRRSQRRAARRAATSHEAARSGRPRSGPCTKASAPSATR